MIKKAFRVAVCGMGVFTGSRPVLHLQVVKASEMMDMHEEMEYFANAVCAGANHLYSADYWMPLITLSYLSSATNELICASKDLALEEIQATLLNSNLALIEQDVNVSGLDITLLPEQIIE